MTEIVQQYVDLPSEDTWIAYLRTRLPYSFRRIRKGTGTPIPYILAEPLLSTGLAEYHNFWKRGYVYYAVGKLIDMYHLPEYWKEYRSSHTDRHKARLSGRTDQLVRFPRHVFNALQLEKLWRVVSEDHLDRERAVMTNLTQAIEFCLKAVKTHAEYRETGAFTFDEGHDISAIYQSLPTELQLEMYTESITFAEDYDNYRLSIEDKMSKLEKRMFEASHLRAPPDVEVWNIIADDIDRTNYTAFVNSNDAGSAGSVGCSADEWFDSALKGIGQITYHRYSPFQDLDLYPTKPIHLGILLGRFLYEHLFPVTPVAEHQT